MRPDLPSAVTSSAPPVSPFARIAAVTILTGVGAGLGGMLLALLLHAIQHVAYGYSVAHVIGNQSFLSGVTDADPLRRLAVLVVCGIVAGGGWWLLYRYGRPLVSIRRAVRAADPRMPFVSTTVHALLQIVTVALGSPLGREVAPREIGALLAGRFAHRAGLTPGDCRLMVACGAGAGLAAVYNVPLGGAIFVLEVLLGSFELRALIVAIVTSAIAAAVAWIGLGNEHQYTVPPFVSSTPLVVWSIVCGPLFGFAAYGFVRLTSHARGHAPKDWRLPVLALLNFAMIGWLAMRFPQLLGNGKGPASLGFDGTLTIGLAAVLLALKVLIEATSLRAGAEGGLLTPGLANGALLGIVLGGLWSAVWPGASIGGCALIGATAFLAASMQMPITAVVLLLEFTRANHDCLVPMLLAVAGSLVAYRWAERLAERRRRAQAIGVIGEHAAATR
ncbi:chloride channel protein [Burkholderia pseudomultivorans]|uniref:H(+)/Cl(-) exchange transporter ClcA n=1 Tax=Burkholderia pseudomultivorans TaxID=1207504 RepID=A0ABU2ECP8_9BURK|nr:chloride channel protein [Burkholderia pseudomultivorans]MDR8731303.1 H(+)/Cl(-) exchange transporter ClcA [Burkholderia pseudomultivorans]MDR8737658.1 H(+)/Cl(-) exchange transporter ClcA [Burkholderia pseudomultivorans]MDR8745041.1 H(+)/Cl(-) exchange transporter ClcA [Burkholderia pseudomultivorans]MDR8757650.1 H(+)/Cl(-) exchange transporter ClcA [Burkholderia pseudomultivorans]MDR8781780.1 H(+)/Cl(-) exchange transporter ClcA [Burkholderia pseudomultivorans]